MSLAELDKLIDDVSERQETLRKQEDEELTRAISKAFEVLPGLNTFHVIGWTPGFNDGMPCYHSHETLVSYEDYANHGFEEYYEAVAADLDWEGDLEDFKVNDLTEDEITSIANIFSVWRDTVQRRWDTDFCLTFVRDVNEPTGFKVEKNDYECGY